MTVTLLDSMGDDLTIVNSAKASLDRFSSYQWETVQVDDSIELVLAESDKLLLGSLARNRHGTPFEGPIFRFQVETSIRVAREWMRHRIASYNEMSTRFMVMSEERDKCYIPTGEAWRRNKADSRIMQYAFDPIVDNDLTNYMELRMRYAYKIAFDVYDELIDLGLAREVAAYVLPIGMRTTFICQMNLRALFNFLSLRNAPQALYELRQEAIAVEEIVAEVCPVAYKFWIEGGRVAI